MGSIPRSPSRLSRRSHPTVRSGTTGTRDQSVRDRTIKTVYDIAGTITESGATGTAM